MEKGQLRCDANISVRPIGTEKLGTKVELKNLNTISGVKNGVEYEIKRQTKAILEGETILQETRRWNPEQKYTTSMRSKEMAHDYRYFPDPDLMPVKIDSNWIDQIKKELPEKPLINKEDTSRIWVYPIPLLLLFVLTFHYASFLKKQLLSKDPQKIANWVVNGLLREISSTHDCDKPISVKESPVSPKHLAELVEMIENGDVSNNVAKEIFPEMFSSGKKSATVSKRKRFGNKI